MGGRRAQKRKTEDIEFQLPVSMAEFYTYVLIAILSRTRD